MGPRSRRGILERKRMNRMEAIEVMGMENGESLSTSNAHFQYIAYDEVPRGVLYVRITWSTHFLRNTVRSFIEGIET